MKWLCCLYAKNGLGRFALSALPHTSKKVNEARGGLILEAGRVRSMKKEIEKKSRKNSPHPKRATKSTATGDRDHLETARKKHVPRVSLHSPASVDPGLVKIGLVQLSQSVKTTNVIHTLTDTQAN